MRATSSPFFLLSCSLRPAIAAIFALSLLTASAEEHYVDSWNPVRIYRWETLDLLRTIKVKAVKIDAATCDELIAQVKKAVHGVKGADKIRFTLHPTLWEAGADASTCKIKVMVKMNVRDGDLPDLLTLIRRVSELSQMTFSVKENEIVFRPLIG